ncbi:CCAAT-box-binding transcription factor [Pseudohyphozyma bogoriensis]|nr:CCAAT-box-binding transcription factor [Pseudohyphozyma bogoriensis]
MASLKANPYAKAVVGAAASPAAASKKSKPKRAPAAGPSSAKHDALRKEVLAMGGNEEELRMLLEVDSESEVEGEEAPKKGKKGKDKKGDSAVDPELSKDLRALFKSLDFAAAGATAPAESDDEEEAADNEDEEEESGSDSDSEEEEEEDDNSDESEAEEEVKQVAPPTKVEPAKADKKESKYEREERRKAEREESKAKELEEKAAVKQAKPTVPVIKTKSPWIVDPTPQWYAVPLPAFPASTTRPTPSTIASLHTRAIALLEKENTLYASSLTPRSSSSAPPPPNGLSKADQVFIQQILTSGTSSDKVSALLLLVSSAPLHTKSYLEQLSALCKKKSREESGRAVRGVVDWWRGEGGAAPARKLRTFADQPGLETIAKAMDVLDGKVKSSGGELTRQEVERTLVIWAFEDWLKKWFFEILKALEQMSVDPLPHPRSQAVIHLSNLLRDKPEQEGNILRLLVNKLGDSQRNVASKTSFLLLQILQFHPGMTPIMVREVSSLILRPSVSAAPSSHVRFGKDAVKEKVKDAGQDHARYYGVITLNQVMLNKNQAEVAGKMIEVYFQIFGDILGRVKDEEEAEASAEPKVAGEKRKRGGGKPGKGKKGEKDEKAEGEVSETDSKLVAAVLTGVNRAFPFAKLDDEAFKKRLDTLFRITHTGTFNVSIQALMLIYHVSAAKRDVSDRFYRALYASLYDPRLAGSSKQALYLNLVFKAMKQDRNPQRVTALIKRLVQVMLGMEVTFILGSLFIVGELLATVSGLRKLLTEPESAERSVPAINAQTAESTEESGRSDDLAYDGKKREPRFANAQNSCLWELVPLLDHWHPSVALHAEQLLNGEPISASNDLEQHSLNHFLDRLVYREVKKNVSTKGSSMMQSGVAGQDVSGRIVMKKGPARGDDAVVNSDAFRNKDAADVPVDQLFFHKYFSSKTAQGDDKAKASKKRKARKGKDDSSDEESIADLGFSDKEDGGLIMPMDEDDEEEEEEEGSDEEEIWQAMKASMPKAEGSDDSEDDIDVDDDDDDDLAEFDYTDSEEEEVEETPFKSAFDEENEMDDEDAGLLEDEDDLIGSDEDMPVFESEEEDEGKAKKGGKSDRRDKKKQKLKHLPVFATADDYAHLLGASDDEDDE